MLSGAAAAHILRLQSFLLDDARRLDTWQTAIRATVRPGDVVLDLGAGMGILSLLACAAGARRVYAVEASASAELARMVAADNGLEERIVCLRDRSQAVELEEPADVLVTDTTETLGLNGRLLSAVIDARDRLLRPGARMLPGGLALRLVPVEMPRMHRHLVGMWDEDVRGFDLRSVRPFAANNGHPADVTPEAFLAEPAEVGAIDLRTAESPAFGGSARTAVTRAGTLHGLGGFFAAGLSDGVVLSNDPREPTVGYTRAFLPLLDPLPVEAGDEVEIEVDTHDGREWRWSVSRGAQRRSHATLHGFPRTREDLLPSG